MNLMLNICVGGNLDFRSFLYRHGLVLGLLTCLFCFADSQAAPTAISEPTQISLPASIGTDGFGFALAIDEDTAVIGSRFYMFVYQIDDDGQWQLLSTINEN